MQYRGVVQKGKQQGAISGFPTINIPLDDGNLSGIFAARVFVGGAEYPAAAYADLSRNILEAHLLDFSGDLYGKEVGIELLEKIRDDGTFCDDAALQAAIAADVAKVREYFTT